MKIKATYKLMKDVTPSDRSVTHLCQIHGKFVSAVPLCLSKEVAFSSRGNLVISSADPAQNRRSARVNLKSRRSLDRGIQLYRLWFNYLKLALELESLNVSLVTKRPTTITNLKNPNEPIPADILKSAAHLGRGGRDGEASGFQRIFRCRKVENVRVDKGKYVGWDLDQVLNLRFDEWWETHSQLFEGFYPSVMQSQDEWLDDPNFIYVRIDKTSQWTDVQHFMREELSPLVKQEGRSRFKISGKNPRVNVLQNNFNALILSIKGWSPKEICTHEKIFLRRTDEHFDSTRTKGDRLTVKTQNGLPKYSATVSAQRMMGIHHLFEVCKGRFGIAPPSKTNKVS